MINGFAFFVIKGIARKQQKTDNFSLKLVDMSLTKDFAFDYIKTKSMVDHFKLSKWQDINIGVYI